MNHLQTVMTAGMALGNWVNTPSPPLDEDSAPSVGNEGKLLLRLEEQEWPFSVDRAVLTESENQTQLELAGEPWGQSRLFNLKFSLPEDWDKADPSGRGRPHLCPSCQGEECFLEVDGEKITVTEGHLQLTGVTGSGPWEVDGQGFLSTSEANYTAIFQIRVSKA